MGSCMPWATARADSVGHFRIAPRRLLFWYEAAMREDIVNVIDGWLQTGPLNLHIYIYYIYIYIYSYS
jgi:hypothetical protein